MTARMELLRLMEAADEHPHRYSDEYLEYAYGPSLDVLLDNPALAAKARKERTYA